MGTVLSPSQKLVLQKIVNSINEGIFLLSSEYEIIYYNSEFVEMFSIPQALIENNDVKAIAEYVKTLFHPDKNIKEVCGIFTYRHQGTHEFALKDGRYFTCSVKPLEVFDLKCLLYSFREITKEKLYEKLLKKNQIKYQRLLNHIPDLVILHNKFRCLYANFAVANFLGYDNPKELHGMDLKRFLTKDAIYALRNMKEEIQNKRIGSPIELQVMDKNNKIQWLEYISHTNFQRGRQIWMSVFRDISEKKTMVELEKLIREREEALEEKRKEAQCRYDFFANFSHELKTPVSIISAASCMLGQEFDKSTFKGRRYIDIIDANCKRLVRDINNFIDIEKIRSTHFKSHMKTCNIIKVIEDITLSVVPYTDLKNIRLEFDTDSEEKFIKVDLYSLERVILNLLSNAIKFTEAGGKIQVLVKDLGGEIEISVSDTGLGISQEDLLHIFERFGQGNQSTIHSGSGIGLHLVKNLVGIMGGRISLISEVGKGSSFRITLPAKDVDIVGVEEAEKLSMESLEFDEITKIEFSKSE